MYHRGDSGEKSGLETDENSREEVMALLAGNNDGFGQEGKLTGTEVDADAQGYCGDEGGSDLKTPGDIADIHDHQIGNET